MYIQKQVIQIQRRIIMRTITSNRFLLIIAALLVLTTLQSCEPAMCLINLGLLSNGYKPIGWNLRQTYSLPHNQTHRQTHRLTYRQTYSTYDYIKAYKRGKTPKETVTEEKTIKTRKEECSVCNGMGLVEWEPEFYMSGNRCEICQKKKNPDHRHPIKCKNCDGEGYIRVPIDEKGSEKRELKKEVKGGVKNGN